MILDDFCSFMTECALRGISSMTTEKSKVQKAKMNSKPLRRNLSAHSLVNKGSSA